MNELAEESEDQEPLCEIQSSSYQITGTGLGGAKWSRPRFSQAPRISNDDDDVNEDVGTTDRDPTKIEATSLAK